jgi:hypothetical protein
MQLHRACCSCTWRAAAHASPARQLDRHSLQRSMCTMCAGAGTTCAAPTDCSRCAPHQPAPSTATARPPPPPSSSSLSPYTHHTDSPPSPALQTTSDLQNLQTSQDEIDFEFLNGANGIPTWFAGSVWTNMFINGSSVKANLLEPPALASATENPAFKTFSDYHSYVIDWQPGYIRWYIDGQLVDQRLGADVPIPVKQQSMHFSVWTKTQNEPTTDTWGGVFDPSHPNPFITWVTNAQRVACDLPNQQTMSRGAQKVTATYETVTGQAAPLVVGTPLALPPAAQRSPPPSPAPSPPPASPSPPPAPPSPPQSPQAPAIEYSEMGNGVSGGAIGVTVVSKDTNASNLVNMIDVGSPVGGVVGVTAVRSSGAAKSQNGAADMRPMSMLAMTAAGAVLLLLAAMH